MCLLEGTLQWFSCRIPHTKMPSVLQRGRSLNPRSSSKSFKTWRLKMETRSSWSSRSKVGCAMHIRKDIAHGMMTALNAGHRCLEIWLTFRRNISEKRHRCHSGRKIERDGFLLWYKTTGMQCPGRACLAHWGKLVHIMYTMVLAKLLQSVCCQWGNLVTKKEFLTSLKVGQLQSGNDKAFSLLKNLTRWF